MQPGTQPGPPSAPALTPGSAPALQRLATWIIALFTIIVVALTAYATWITKAWPLVHDEPFLHYGVFLMQHGKAPYRDFIELNMPGTYLMTSAVMHTLGAGAAGWWRFNLLSALVALLACAWIAGPRQRLAGIAAGALVFLFTLRTGIYHMGERDWFLSVMLLLAIACLFHSLRHHQPAWMAGFMALCAFASSVKPLIVLFAVFFLVAACALRLRWKLPLLPLIAWSIAGSLLPIAMVLAFLMKWGVTATFIDTLRTLLPWYASLGKPQYGHLLTLLSPTLWAVLCTAVFFLLNRSWRHWESLFLLAATGFGVLVYLMQGKGFPYHLYEMAAFLFLWCLLEVSRALRASTLRFALATAVLLFLSAAILPRYLKLVRESTYPMETLTSLQSDLTRLGGLTLSGNVQCLDMTFGSCINVLYRLQLVQSTGFLSDFLILPEQHSAETGRLQARFLSEITAHPPQVYILSTHTWPSNIRSYDRLQRWPAFAQLLAHDYILEKEFTGSKDSLAGYRIYLRRRPTPSTTRPSTKSTHPSRYST